MKICPICKDKKTREEMEQQRYRMNHLYKVDIKMNSRREAYYVCDKCKAAWLVRQVELAL